MKEMAQMYSDNGFVGCGQELSETITFEDGESYKMDIKLKLIVASDIDRMDVAISCREAIRNMYRREVHCEHDCSAQWFGGVVGDIKYRDGLYHFSVAYSLDV